VAIVPLLRAFTLEAWLTALIGGKHLSGAAGSGCFQLVSNAPGIDLS